MSPLFAPPTSALASKIDRFSHLNSSLAKSLVILDAQVDDLSVLMADIIADNEVFVIDPQQDGIEQITTLMAQYPELTQLHLITHGSSGQITLGSAQLSLASIDRYTEKLQAWKTLQQGCDLLVYGCQVAEGVSGSLFLQKLHLLTGFNIAASESRVGRVNGRVQWALETRIGSVKTPVIFSQALQNKYQGHFEATEDGSVPIGALELPLGPGANIFTTGDLAFISGENELLAVDLSNSSIPSLLSETPLGATISSSDVTIAGTLAFLTVDEVEDSEGDEAGEDGEADLGLVAGLAVFDISEPDAPELLSNVPFETSAISNIVVSEEQNLFVANNPDTEELSIGMFSDLGLASLDQTIPISGGASEVIIAPSGLALVAGDIGEDIDTQSSNLTIVDPLSGTIISSLDFTANVDGAFDPFGIAVTPDEDFAFVSGGFVSSEVAVFDIKDPANPSFVTTVETADVTTVETAESQALGISLADDRLFVSNLLEENDLNEGFVSVLDVSDPSNPEVDEIIPLSPLDLPVDVSAVTLDDEGIVRAVSVGADLSATGGPPGGVSVIEIPVADEIFGNTTNPDTGVRSITLANEEEIVLDSSLPISDGVSDVFFPAGNEFL